MADVMDAFGFDEEDGDKANMQLPRSSDARHAAAVTSPRGRACSAAATPSPVPAFARPKPKSLGTPVSRGKSILHDVLGELRQEMRDEKAGKIASPDQERKRIERAARSERRAFASPYVHALTKKHRKPIAQKANDVCNESVSAVAACVDLDRVGVTKLQSIQRFVDAAGNADPAELGSQPHLSLDTEDSRSDCEAGAQEEASQSRFVQQASAASGTADRVAYAPAVGGDRVSRVGAVLAAEKERLSRAVLPLDAKETPSRPKPLHTDTLMLHDTVRAADQALRKLECYPGFARAIPCLSVLERDREEHMRSPAPPSPPSSSHHGEAGTGTSSVPNYVLSPVDASLSPVDDIFDESFVPDSQPCGTADAVRCCRSSDSYPSSSQRSGSARRQLDMERVINDDCVYPPKGETRELPEPIIILSSDEEDSASVPGDMQRSGSSPRGCGRDAPRSHSRRYTAKTNDFIATAPTRVAADERVSPEDLEKHSASPATAAAPLRRKRRVGLAAPQGRRRAMRAAS